MLFYNIFKFPLIELSMNWGFHLFFSSSFRKRQQKLSLCSQLFHNDQWYVYGFNEFNLFLLCYFIILYFVLDKKNVALPVWAFVCLFVCCVCLCCTWMYVWIEFVSLIQIHAKYDDNDDGVCWLKPSHLFLQFFFMLFFCYANFYLFIFC